MATLPRELEMSRQFYSPQMRVISPNTSGRECLNTKLMFEVEFEQIEKYQYGRHLIMF